LDGQRADHVRDFESSSGQSQRQSRRHSGVSAELLKALGTDPGIFTCANVRSTALKRTR
jgi:hypothetical protein